jgi:citrate synthase
VEPDEPGLSAAEAATRLGVKRQTLYAYVSRGLLTRTVASDGRTSRFEPAEIDRLLTDKRRPAEGELRTVISTRLTRVDDQGLWIRGQDLVRLVGNGAGFTDVVEILWDAPPGESWDLAPSAVSTAAPPVPSLLDALRIITAQRSAADPLRYDLSPRSVRAVGRLLIVALCRELPVLGPGTDRSLAASLWCRLSTVAASEAQLRTVDSAMALLVDHGLAGSTFAARIAASVRADPYSVVSAGMGVMGGTLHGAASGSVHELLLDIDLGGDATMAVGAVRRRLGVFPGFGHSIYRIQDPRYGPLMAQVVDAWGSDPRLVNVYRVRDLISQRSDAIPNIDLALGALTYLARMPVDAGEMIFAIARTAGWLAHAMEEYEESPLRFRTRDRYIGLRPSSGPGPKLRG